MKYLGVLRNVQNYIKLKMKKRNWESTYEKCLSHLNRMDNSRLT